MVRAYLNYLTVKQNLGKTHNVNTTRLWRDVTDATGTRNFAVCVKEVYLIEPPKLILKPLLRPLHKEQVRTDITSLFVVE